MKSYLRFLSRNKLYTAIEVVGLSLALAFVIVLSSYIVDDMSVNKELKNTDDTGSGNQCLSIISGKISARFLDLRKFLI